MQVNIVKIEDLAQQAAELEYTTDSQKDKQEIWVEMGKELEAANYEKEKISARIKTLIDKHLRGKYKDLKIPEKSVKFKSGHFERTMAVQGWTDQTKNHMNDAPPGGRPNSSTLNEFKSSCYEERKNDIIFLDKFIKLFQSLTNELEIEYDDVKVGGKEKTVARDWTKYYTEETKKFHADLHDVVANLIDEWNQSIDKRYSLLPKMKIVAPAIANAVATTSSFCSRHYTILKSKTEISPKTYKKFMDDVKSYSDFLKILQCDAWKYYSLPIPCQDCGEYTLRTRLSSNGTWHFVCVNKLAHKQGQPEYPAGILKDQIEKIITDKKEAQKLLKYYNYPEDI